MEGDNWVPGKTYEPGQPGTARQTGGPGETPKPGKPIFEKNPQRCFQTFVFSAKTQKLSLLNNKTQLVKNAPGSQSNDGAPPSIFPPHIFSHCSVYLLTLIRIFAHIGAYICSHCCIYLLKLLPSIATEICPHICSVDLLTAKQHTAYICLLVRFPFSQGTTRNIRSLGELSVRSRRLSAYHNYHYIRKQEPSESILVPSTHIGKALKLQALLFNHSVWRAGRVPLTSATPALSECL